MSERCEWRILNDYYEVCTPKAETEVEDADRGSWLGWLLCALAGSSFTLGSRYDRRTDTCECRGDFRPSLFRR